VHLTEVETKIEALTFFKIPASAQDERKEGVAETLRLGVNSMMTSQEDTVNSIVLHW
jgi:hypothetical protein